MHQVNIEYLARVVMTRDGKAYPDTLVGTDSHTTMVNGLGVLGWGVGGIEAEAAMLGQPVSMLIPRVVGFKLTGELPEGATATDLVLTITEMLRKHGVVGKFVEFYGPGVGAVPLANRATIGNMSPEYGSTVRDLPDRRRRRCATCASPAGPRSRSRWSRRTPRSRGSGTTRPRRAGLLRDLELDLSTVVPSLAGPKRPQDRVLAVARPRRVPAALRDYVDRRRRRRTRRPSVGELPGLRPAGDRPASERSPPAAADARASPRDRSRSTTAPTFEIDHGVGGHRGDHLVHQHVQPVGDARRRAAGEEGGRARAAAQAVGEDLASRRAPRWSWTTTSAPASCPTWTSSASTSSATAAPPASATPARCPRRSRRRQRDDLAVVSVLSGNRNFEGRINPDVKMNYLASPPLVVAYALAGTMDFDIATEPLGTDEDGEPVYLRDIWPSPAEIAATIADVDRPEHVHRATTPTCSPATSCGRSLPTPTGDTFEWDADSTYVRKPPYFEGMPPQPAPVDRHHAARGCWPSSATR